MNIFEKDQAVIHVALALSLVLHAVLFINFSSTNFASKSQAPKYATMMSLKISPAPEIPVKQIEKQVKQPEPLAKKQAVKKIVKAKKKLQPRAQQQAVAQTVSKNIQRQDAEESKIVKQRYLSKLLTIIEGNKYYPLTARRRGIEGNIHVSFILKNDGYVNGLDASGGPALLRRAAKIAVTKSLPLPTKPDEIDYPMHVSYAMLFKLK